MNLEKSVSITAPSTNGKLAFVRDGDDLGIHVLDATGALHDSATLTEADLRGLVRELFPSKRAPKAPGATVGNGTSRKRKGEAANT